MPGAGGVNSLDSRGVTEDVELPKELTPVTSHSIAFVEATLHRPGMDSIRQTPVFALRLRPGVEEFLRQAMLRPTLTGPIPIMKGRDKSVGERPPCMGPVYATAVITDNLEWMTEDYFRSGGGRLGLRRYPNAGVRPGNISCAAHPTLRCLRGFPFSAT